MSYALKFGKRALSELAVDRLAVYGHLERRGTTNVAVYLRLRHLAEYHSAKFPVARLVTSSTAKLNMNLNWLRHSLSRFLSYINLGCFYILSKEMKKYQLA